MLYWALISTVACAAVTCVEPVAAPTATRNDPTRGNHDAPNLVGARKSADFFQTVQNPEATNMLRVIVTLKNISGGPEHARAIAAAQDRVLKSLEGHNYELTHKYDVLPQMALTVDKTANAILRAHPDVANVSESRLHRSF